MLLYYGEFPEGFMELSPPFECCFTGAKPDNSASNPIPLGSYLERLLHRSNSYLYLRTDFKTQNLV